MLHNDPVGWYLLAVIICIPGVAIGAGVGALCLEGTKYQGIKTMSSVAWGTALAWSLACAWLFSQASGDGTVFCPALVLSPAVATAFAAFGVPYYRQQIKMKLLIAYKLLAAEGSVIDVLDQDKDSIVSLSDIQRATPLVLGSPFTQPELNLLSSSMADFGHDIGNDSQHFFIISRSDLVNLKDRLRETYKNWRSEWPDNW